MLDRPSRATGKAKAQVGKYLRSKKKASVARCSEQEDCGPKLIHLHNLEVKDYTSLTETNSPWFHSSEATSFFGFYYVFWHLPWDFQIIGLHLLLLLDFSIVDLNHWLPLVEEEQKLFFSPYILSHSVHWHSKSLFNMETCPLHLKKLSVLLFVW